MVLSKCENHDPAFVVSQHELFAVWEFGSLGQGTFLSLVFV
jgi:hypothetical protein